MAIRVVIPSKEIMDNTQRSLSQLAKAGIDSKHLLQYSLAINELGDFTDIKSYITKDILEVFPDLRTHGSEYQTLLHQCIDCVQELGCQLLIVTKELINDEDVSYNHLQFDRFIGDDLSIYVNR